MEKRKDTRITAEQFLKDKSRKYKKFIAVGDMKSGQLMGHILDLSLSGIRLIGDMKFEESKVYSIRIEFDSGTEDPTFIALDAQCVWCNSVKESELFETGCRFLKISERELKTLSILLEEWLVH